MTNKKNNTVSIRLVALILSALVVTAGAVAGVLKLHGSQETKIEQLHSVQRVEIEQLRGAQKVEIERLKTQTAAHDKTLSDVNVTLGNVNAQMTGVRVELGVLQTEQRTFKDEVLRELKKRDP